MKPPKCLEDPINDGAPAMTLKLDDIFAGRTCRFVEADNNRSVKDLAASWVAQSPDRRGSRRREDA